MMQTPEVSPLGPEPKTPKQHACVLCQQRKIKCDRNYPCSNCTKTKADCKFVAPAPRRRKRQSPEHELLTRLQRCEQLLRKHGIEVESGDDRQTSGLKDAYPAVDEGKERVVKRRKESLQTQEYQPNSFQGGRLIIEDGSTRYVEENLWNTVNDEISYAQLVGKHDDNAGGMSWNVYPNGGGLLFGLNPPKIDIKSMHPTMEQQVILWKAFQENVNSLFKLVHVPTLEKKIFDGIADVASMAKNLNPLIFAINTAAINSIPPNDCQRIMGESRSRLLPKLMAATQHALIQAGLLKSSDLMVLQAFVLFLITAQSTFDPYSLLILTGAAIRIAQRIGIHRDGTSLGLSIFQTEMRRRLWWQVYVLDGQTNRLAGTGSSLHTLHWDTKFPLNVNDADLQPDMTQLPVEGSGGTEMVICMLRYEMCTYMQSNKDKMEKDGGWQNFVNNRYTIEERNKAAETFEEMLQDKYLKYCDPLNPVQFIAILMARSFLCKINIIQNFPRLRPNQSPEELDKVLRNTIKIIEYTNLVHSTKSLQRFFWHMRAANFQFETFIFLLNELRTRTSGDIADHAWVQIEESFKCCPERITDTRNPLFVAMGNLLLKAWNARKMAVPGIEDPEFVKTLIGQRGGDNKGMTEFETQQIPREGLSIDQVTVQPTIEMSPMDWGYWDELLHEFEIPLDIMNEDARA